MGAGLGWDTAHFPHCTRHSRLGCCSLERNLSMGRKCWVPWLWFCLCWTGLTLSSLTWGQHFQRFQQSLDQALWIKWLLSPYLLQAGSIHCRGIHPEVSCSASGGSQLHRDLGRKEKYKDLKVTQKIFKKYYFILNQGIFLKNVKHDYKICKDMVMLI